MNIGRRRVTTKTCWTVFYIANCQYCAYEEDANIQIYEDYTVTDKADGEKTMMTMLMEKYLIDIMRIFNILIPNKII